MSGKPASRPAKSGTQTGPGRGRMAAGLYGAERHTQRTRQPRRTAGRARPRSGTQADPARPPVSVHRGTQLWSHADDVTIFGGWGGYEQGWDAVSRRLDWAASRFGEGHADIGNLAAGSSGDLAYSIDIETNVGLVDGAPGRVTALRVTHICQRAGGGWRVVHRHADASGRARTRHRSRGRIGWRLSPGSGPATTVILVTGLPRRRRMSHPCSRAGDDAGC